MHELSKFVDAGYIRICTYTYINIYSRNRQKPFSHTHGNFSAKALDLFCYRDCTKKTDWERGAQSLKKEGILK